MIARIVFRLALTGALAGVPALVMAQDAAKPEASVAAAAEPVDPLAKSSEKQEAEGRAADTGAGFIARE